MWTLIVDEARPMNLNKTEDECREEQHVRRLAVSNGQSLGFLTLSAH